MEKVEMTKAAHRKSCTCALVLLLALSILHAAKAQEHAETAHHPFHDAGHWIHVFESPERATWQKPEEVVRAFDLKRGQTVVDIGAGTGYFTRRFARAIGPSGKAIGVDIEPSMVAYMKADTKKHKLSNYEARPVKSDDPELAPHSPMSFSFATWISTTASPI
jgi:SAM-dependent methyltransferase